MSEFGNPEMKTFRKRLAGMTQGFFFLKATASTLHCSAPFASYETLKATTQLFICHCKEKKSPLLFLRRRKNREQIWTSASPHRDLGAMDITWQVVPQQKKPFSHFFFFSFFFTVNSSKAKALNSGSLLWFSITNYSVIFLRGDQVKFWFISWKSWKALLMLPLALLTATIFRSGGIAGVQPSAIFSRSLFLCRFSLLLSCAESTSIKTVTLAYILERWLMKRIWIWNFKGELNSDPHLRDPEGALRINWYRRRDPRAEGLSVLIFSGYNNREATKQQNSICLPLSIPIHLCPQTY